MHFPTRAVSILFLSIFGHKIGVLKSPALFQGKELQAARFKVTRFCFHILTFVINKPPLDCRGVNATSMKNVTVDVH